MNYSKIATKESKKGLIYRLVYINFETMGNLPQQIFFDQYDDLEPDILLSVASGG